MGFIFGLLLNRQSMQRDCRRVLANSQPPYLKGEQKASTRIKPSPVKFLLGVSHSSHVMPAMKTGPITQGTGVALVAEFDYSSADLNLANMLAGGDPVGAQNEKVILNHRL